MSRSVSAPSSVTKTSPCWNGLIVPGSMFRYGSNFWAWTRRPRALSRRPSEAATMPLPSAETTPPVTKTYFVWRTASRRPAQRVEVAEAGRALDQRPERGAVTGEIEGGEEADRDETSAGPHALHGLQP